MSACGLSPMEARRRAHEIQTGAKCGLILFDALLAIALQALSQTTTANAPSRAASHISKVGRMAGELAKNEPRASKPRRNYIPAAGFHWLLPLFDWVTKITGADRARSILLEQAEFRPGQQVLDIGCGTGSLAILLKQLRPEIEVVGLDPDPKALALADRKAQRAGVSTRFDQGFSDALEYASDSFDHVLSSFMFHHLRSDQKEATFREIRRVLKPGGYLHLLDFRGLDIRDTRAVSLWFHSRSILRDNAESRILSLMTKAGLAEATVVGRQTVVFGFAHVAYYQACALKLPFSRDRFPDDQHDDGLIAFKTNYRRRP